MVLGECGVGCLGWTSFVRARRAVRKALMRMACGQSLGILVMDVALWHAVTIVTTGKVACHASTRDRQDEAPVGILRTVANLMVLKVSP